MFPLPKIPKFKFLRRAKALTEQRELLHSINNDWEDIKEIEAEYIKTKDRDLLLKAMARYKNVERKLKKMDKLAEKYDSI